AALMPHGAAVEVAVRHARHLNSRLYILARASNAAEVRRLKKAGADAVVQPEFEAGVEVIRQALERYGIFGLELDHVIPGRRPTFYSHAAPGQESQRAPLPRLRRVLPRLRGHPLPRLRRVLPRLRGHPLPRLRRVLPRL